MALCRPIITALATLGILVAPGADNAADAQTHRPESSTRLVASWDFEERDVHLEPVPRNWFRAHSDPPERPRPGFPSWNLAVLDDAMAAGGRWAVRLPTSGGSTSLMLAGGVVPVMPDADYLISAHLRTQHLVHARGRIVAWFLDDRLNRIENTVVASEPVLTGGAWQQALLKLQGHTDAAWIQLELQLLQPEQYADPKLDEFQTMLQDLHGAVWFDEVSIFQVPRVDLSTNDPANVIIGPEEPVMQIIVRDMAGEPLQAHLEVFDLQGRSIDRTTEPVSASGHVSRWRPRLPAFGWYRTTLVISGSQREVDAVYLDFIWAPPEQPIDPTSFFPFALLSEHAATAHRDLLPRLARAMRSGTVHLAVWGTEPVGDAAEPARSPLLEALNDIVTALLEQDQEVIFVLADAPPSIARKAQVDPHQTMDVLLADEKLWMPSLRRYLTKFGERVGQWQIGRSTDDSAFWRTNLNADLDQIRTRWQQLIPRAVISVPWKVEQPIEKQRGVDGLVIDVPTATPPGAISLYAAQWPEEANITLALSSLDVGIYGRHAAAIDLARRMALAHAAPGVDQIALTQPWSPNPLLEEHVLPHAELAVWRTMTEALAGRRFAGEMRVVEGARILIFEGRNGGALIAWNDSADPQLAEISGYLGEGPIIVRDVFGNQHEADATASGHVIPLDESPIIVEGADILLARFRAGLRIEPGFIPARAERHDVELIIENPWPVTITGRMRLAGPDSWEIGPGLVQFNIPGGASERIPLEIMFGIGDEAGTRPLTAEIDLTADRRYPVMHVPFTVETGLRSFQLTPSYIYDVGADGMLSDIIVTMLITNTDDTPRTLNAQAIAPGYRAFQAPISSLAPGETTIRRFRFEDGVASLRGRNIRVSVREQDGTGRITKTLLIQ